MHMIRIRSKMTFFILIIHAVSIWAGGKVYPAADKTYPGFKPHQLPFETPKDGIARAEAKSENFFAVILKTAKRCAITESQRAMIQAGFPKHKVFFDRFGCHDDEENVTYTNVNKKYGFIAVYAGSNLAQAKQFLKKVLAGKQYPGANIRKMQVVLVYH